MTILKKVAVRLTLDIAVQVTEIDPLAPGVVDPGLAKLCAKIQRVVLRHPKLLAQQVDLELAIFIDSLDPDKVLALLSLDNFDPYRHPDLLLETIAEEDASVLRATGPYLSESLNDLTDSFQAEITNAAVERLY
jgi:hypothetical protein